MKRNFYIRLICFIIAIISVGLMVLHMYHLAFSYAMRPNMQGLGVMLGLFGSLGIVAIKISTGYISPYCDDCYQQYYKDKPYSVIKNWYGWTGSNIENKQVVS